MGGSECRCPDPVCPPLSPLSGRRQQDGWRERDGAREINKAYDLDTEEEMDGKIMREREAGSTREREREREKEVWCEDSERRKKLLDHGGGGVEAEE